MATAIKPSISQSAIDTVDHRRVHSTPHHEVRQSLFVIADLCGIAAGAVLAIFFRFPATPAINPLTLSEHFGIAILYAVLIVLFCHTQRLYSVCQPSTFDTEFAAILKSIVMATILLSGSLFLTGVKSTSRLVIVCTSISALTTMTAWRQFRRQNLKKAFADGVSCHNVLIVGTDHLALAVAQHLARHRQLGFLVVGHLGVNSTESGEIGTPPTVLSVAGSTPLLESLRSESRSIPPNSPKLLGTKENLRALIRTHFIDEVIICTHHRSTILEIISEARNASVGVRVIPDLYDGLAWGARLDYLGDFPTLSVVHRDIPTLSLILKRALDIFGSVVALVMLSPILLFLAIIVKLDSRGPVLYASKRLGKKGRPFPCYKFRTMVADADVLRADLQHLNERDGILFKISNDPRITRVGRFLRKHSLDEIPQFWNVLRGNMSLVGPRPPLTHEVKKYESGYFRRLNVAPGITGLWQVEARNNPSFDRYISLDLQYVEHWSLGLDIQILFRTMAVVLSGTGT